MSRPLEGKLAIVTGAPRGIGLAISEHLASKGANLALCYSSPSSQSLAEDLSQALQSKHNIRTCIAQADLGTPSGASTLISTIKSAFAPEGTKFQIDIIVNNAGVALNNKLPDIKISEFETTYRVNVLGPLLLVQAAQPFLPTDRSGRIVNLSSVSAGCGFVGQSVYGGTKGALEAMTRTWSRELAENCTVNAINPGPVLSVMYDKNTDEFKELIRPFIQHSPLMNAREGVDAQALVEDAKTSGGRPAYPEEIAGIVGMLCLKEAAWCTGQVVSANGGMLMGTQ
ncbi:related to 3-oxoacyl-[acyl-carrier-protein] reductase [Cephalotrichum gorgonifer]|uniref:Related to 3-oxoacyl-[acyl-carrier-protein] reductase n=1 Tax=Cephalotrichum gorgonifer TaxID=2041049 RepID=A0AAE8SRW1_9PEZI|nr:related to 3-oxoacyl-[acyl-carrier-protein] reductase [Cephalotrichum gorgonifer]